MGNKIESSIANAILRTWAGAKGALKIGDMADDVGSLLTDLKSEWSPPPALEVGHLGVLMGLSKVTTLEGTLSDIQRNTLACMDRLSVSMVRLVRISDDVIGIPETTDSGEYNYALRDITTLMSKYSDTLLYLARYLLATSKELDESLDRITTLTDNLKAHKLAVDRYMAMRSK